ncbi:MAG: copper resistance protein B [Rhodospirillaceae bacterium]|nr:copper resistance protein B [Rhodospirillaceae bacterium]
MRKTYCAAIALVLTATAAQAQEKELIFYGVQMEQLEYRQGDTGQNLMVWDGDAFVGTDEIKLRWLGEGEYDTDEEVLESMENRLVLQMPISTFFDLKAGVRLDTPDGPDRLFGVVGVAGLAPQWIEVDADLFVSETGDVSARVDAEYELLITNRLILIPSLEVDVAFTEDREIGVATGLNSVEFGVRLSYDLIDRMLSPYVGVAYERKFGRTADFAREEGEDTSALFGVIGARLMF